MKLSKILTSSAIAILAAFVTIAAPLSLSATPAVAATACETLTRPVSSSFNPSTQAQYLTTDASTKPADFTVDGGSAFAAAQQSASGLVPVTRLYRPPTGDYLFTRSASEVSSAVTRYGYVEQGVAFYALPSASDCGIPVYRYRLGAMHRLVISQSDRDSLTAAGWISEGIGFHAAEATVTDTVFAIAVMPDTQQEVLASSNDRFRQRSQWLADNKENLDLRYVLHTGDVVNWGHVDPVQFTRAQTALAPLTNVNIPYVLTVGNHDTAAVCQGGSACPGANTRVTVRDTSAFNNAFPLSSLPNAGGTYEPNKVENNYITFDAGGKKWLVLTLELWPRTGVVDWAKTVVSSHPDHNVIIQTHSYLNADGSIYTSNGGYGANSPQYLYDNLVSLYSNIKIVLSGHVGNSASRTDTGINGNKIVSLLQGFHSTSNPVRLIEINAQTGALTTRIYAPQDGAYWTQYDLTITGLTFVPGLTATDIGSVQATGSTIFSDGVYTVSGSGGDIWDNADSFHFASRQLAGDGTITARILSQENTNEWAKAGVMIREGLNADAPHALLAVTPANGVALQHRATAGAASEHLGTGGSTPQWLRLVREGASVTGYVSSDGANWTTLGTISVGLGQNVFVGLAVTAHNEQVLSTAMFDNVTVQ